MWNETPFTERIGLRYPIVQGAFGGGFSSARLVAAVSEAGGLGSFGVQHLAAEQILEVASDIRALTEKPFALNLWVSNEDPDAYTVSPERYAAAVEPLKPAFESLGVDLPELPIPRNYRFEEQVPAILEAAPAVFSFVYGVPSADVLAACRERNIITMGCATTVEEAVALDEAGVDVIVATGLEAGGHRVSFLRRAEDSLIGNFSLIPQIVDAVRAPVVAAGGIADARGIVAALALGASAAQVGTAFLACDESNAPAPHREALFSQRAARTVLTRAFTGRLARSLVNKLAEDYAASGATPLPYPTQGKIVSALRSQALQKGDIEHVSLWAGQSARLIQHRSAATLFRELVAQTEEYYAACRQG